MKYFSYVLLITTLVFSHFSYADVSVVVNTANGNAISDSDISRLFLGKLKKFSDGESAKPVNSKSDAAARIEFEKKVLNKSSSQIKAYWSKRVFSGKGKPPKEVADDAAVLVFVAANPGAIGYISSSNVNDSVKVVKTF
mgnify:CR=1 FL=1